MSTQIFGASGFIGSEMLKAYPNDYYCNESKSDLSVHGDSVLYMISTTDNYNVLTNPYIDIETNLIHLMRVLENIKKQDYYKDVKFTFISSWFVYGDVKLPATEESYCNPKGFYSITKRTAEQLVESYCKTFKIPYNIVRLGNVVGKSDKGVSKKKNALQYLINEMKQNNPISLYHRGEFYRDFISIDDAVIGIDKVVNTPLNDYIFNIGSGEKVLFIDIIEHARKLLNSKSNITLLDEAPKFHSTIQTKDMVLDIRKAKVLLDFHPTKNIYQIIEELI